MRLIYPDYMFVFGLLCVFSAGFMTNYMMTDIMGVEGYAEVATELEANPTARAAMDLGYGLFALQLLVNSFMSALYLILRRQWSIEGKERKEERFQTLVFFSSALMFLYLQNVMNDLPILIGLLS